MNENQWGTSCTEYRSQRCRFEEKKKKKKKKKKTQEKEVWHPPTSCVVGGVFEIRCGLFLSPFFFAMSFCPVFFSYSNDSNDSNPSGFCLKFDGVKKIVILVPLKLH